MKASAPRLKGVAYLLHTMRIEFATDGPTVPSWNGEVPYGLMLVDTEAIVSDLTVRGPNAASAIVFVGGAPTLERVTNELEGDYSGRAHTSVAVLNGAGGTITDSLLDGPVWNLNGAPMPEYEGITGTGPFIAEDDVTDGGFSLDVTDGSALLRNTITDDDSPIELSLIGSGVVLVAGNDLGSIELLGASDGFTIRDNVVHASGPGETGITLGTGAPLVEGNLITGEGIGILVPRGASPTITGNQREGLKSGIGVLGAATEAVIEDNRFCGNEQDLVVPEGSSLTLDPSNEVCDDPTE